MQPFICGEESKASVSFSQHCAARRHGCGCAHVNLGRLGEGPDRMDVVVEDDDPDHHSQAERHRLLAGEPAAVLPNGTQSCVRKARAGREGGGRVWYSRRLQHDFTHSCHGAEAVRRVLDGQVLVLWEAQGGKQKQIRGREQAENAALAIISLTSDTNLVVPSLNVFSMGVASA